MRSHFLDRPGAERETFTDINLDRRLLMALTAAVQKLVEEVRQNSDLAKAQNQALIVQAGQIADLKVLNSSLVAGQTVDKENLDAINQSVDTLAETNTQLQAAVPANTSADPNAGKAPLEATGPAPTQPPTNDVAGAPLPADKPVV